MKTLLILVGLTSSICVGQTPLQAEQRLKKVRTFAEADSLNYQQEEWHVWKFEVIKDSNKLDARLKVMKPGEIKTIVETKTYGTSSNTYKLLSHKFAYSIKVKMISINADGRLKKNVKSMRKEIKERHKNGESFDKLGLEFDDMYESTLRSFKSTELDETIAKDLKKSKTGKLVLSEMVESNTYYVFKVIEKSEPYRNLKFVGIDTSPKSNSNSHKITIEF